MAVVSETGVLEFDPLKLEWRKETRGRQYTRLQGGGGRAADVAYINRDTVLFAAQQSNIVASSIYSNSSSSGDIKTIVSEPFITYRYTNKFGRFTRLIVLLSYVRKDQRCRRRSWIIR